MEREDLQNNSTCGKRNFLEPDARQEGLLQTFALTSQKQKKDKMFVSATS